MLTKNQRILGSALVSAALLLQPLSAYAGIVSTEQLTARQNADAERARVQAFVERASAAGKLRALGVDAAIAKERIGALSDAEVHDLAARIDALPAGAGIGGFTDEQVIIVLLLIILVAVLVS
jgi:hypothetical protein